jgi:uncharacterized protein (DUF2141 family)
MKKTILLFLITMTSITGTGTAENNVSSTAPASVPTGSIRVRIDNLRNTSGMLGIALYTTKKGFPDKPELAFSTTSLPANDGQCEAVFDNIPYGTYAVSVLHDENGNRKMDKTFIGMPREGFGTSNNPKINYGPPEFIESQFILDCKVVDLKIAMNYF